MRRALLATLVIATLGGLPARATPATVHIAGFAFQPNSVTVVIGDSVTWQNDDAVAHTTTSDDAFWDSMPLGTGGTFVFTFASAGTFKYHCNIHTGMKAQVVVRTSVGAPEPPQNLTAQPGLGIGEVSLAWQPPLDDGGSPITEYSVCRSTGGGAPACVSAGTALSFVDGGLTPLITYDYVVLAKNALGTSAASNAACSKPFPWLALLGC